MVIDLSIIILITIFGDREIFNHTMRLFQYFLNVFVILHVGVLPSYSKSVITPTYTPEIVALSVCDIISLSIQGVAGVTCYKNQDISQLKSWDIQIISLAKQGDLRKRSP